MELSSFTNSVNGIAFDHTKGMYPSRLVCHFRETQNFSEEFTHTFGYVHAGEVTLIRAGGLEINLTSRMYFSVPGMFTLAGEGHAVMFQRIGFRGLVQFGGPVESIGRLCYMDNCMTSILAGPDRHGDPCLNLLSFPPHIEQSLHVHPSLRLGTVVGGEGACVIPNQPNAPLVPGQAFALEEAQPHCFVSGPEGLLIVAYHPDSDFGPTDQANPMLNRTYLVKK